MKIEDKIDVVKKRLNEFKKVGLAFSGGKDSFFLLKLAVESLGKHNVVAFFVKTNFTPANDENRINYFKNILDFNLKIITVDLSKEKNIASNPKDRCYFCKKKIFKTIKEEALKLNTVQTTLSNPDFKYWVKFGDGKFKCGKGEIEGANINVTCSQKVMSDFLAGNKFIFSEFLDGKIKISGDLQYAVVYFDLLGLAAEINNEGVVLYNE